MTINGVELPFKLTNAASAARYEAALAEMREAAESFAKNPTESLAENVRRQISLVRGFVDRLFGEGTYDKLGADPDDLDESLDIYAQIIADGTEQAKAVQRRNAKYAPERGKRGIKMS